MATNITILGLRQFGVSTALALAEKDDRFLFNGWDPCVDTRSAAKKHKVFRVITNNIHSSLKDAHLVILSLLPNDLRECAEELGKLILEDMVVINITNLQDLSVKWIQEHLSNPGHYVSLLPTLNPALILSNDFDNVKPHAHLFKEGLIYILDPLDAKNTALDLAVDMSVLLGGKPILADPIEIDGLFSENMLLPQIGAAAVMLVAAEQPGWREGSKIAGRALANSTSPLKDAVDAGDVSQTAYFQREHLIRLMSDLINKLIEFRGILTDGDPEKLAQKMEAAVNMRSEWVTDRTKPLPARMLTTSIPDEKQALKRFMKFVDM